MWVRVNGRLAFARALVLLPCLVAGLVGGCGAGGRETAGHGSGSTVEIVWLEPPPDGAPAPIVVLPTAELGDGTAPSETVAGAVRLLGLEVDDQVFLKHALAGALARPDALRPAALPAPGDVARADGITAVVERVDGVVVHLVGLRGGRVERWHQPRGDLRFARP